MLFYPILPILHTCGALHFLCCCFYVLTDHVAHWDFVYILPVHVILFLTIYTLRVPPVCYCTYYALPVPLAWTFPCCSLDLQTYDTGSSAMPHLHGSSGNAATSSPARTCLLPVSLAWKVRHSSPWFGNLNLQDARLDLNDGVAITYL